MSVTSSDVTSVPESMADNVARTLTDRPQRWLSPKWFYDELGSILFDAITRLDEYYPTRREREILAAHADDIVRLSGADTIVELGSGTSEKTLLLLDALHERGHLNRFCPLDVSPEVLGHAADVIAARYPGVVVEPVVGDFLHDLDRIPRGGRRMVAFLGSTIGNLVPEEQHAFLVRVSAALTSGDTLLLGTDLVKDPARLVAAYDDAIGVTAAFNRNVLAVLNRELDADFDLARWRHLARWNDERERMEMHLVADGRQVVRIGAIDLELTVDDGDTIQTETSAKFRVERIADLLDGAGFDATETWTDPAGDVALTLARRR